ncbi:putative serine/threonine-protein kinase PkwA [Hypsizygus marmoreus]|uniref:Serine/threonine-protein kinase PkwA n=1 Tax=Hypsizygus marmoreus TaxID=39966 RepID=A0A369JGZ6_HYPMA|nr:putative serine/threonine-protein kinase PkwA [Hypsizygus marmoreus]
MDSGLALSLLRFFLVTPVPRLSPTTIYKIVNAQSGSVCTVHKPQSIVGYPYNSSGVDYQKWYAVPVSSTSNAYYLKMTWVDAFLAVSGAPDEHLMVGPAKFEWEITPEPYDPTKFKICVKDGDERKVLQLDHGDFTSRPQARVVPEQWGVPSQVWRFEEAGPAPPSPPPRATTLVAAIADHQSVNFWDPESGRLVHSVAVSPGSKILAAVPRNGATIAFVNKHAWNIFVHDIRTLTPLNRRRVGTFANQDILQLSPDGSRLVAANSERATVYNVKSSTEEMTIQSANGMIARVARFKGDNSWLAIGYDDGVTIKVWGLRTCAERTLIMDPRPSGMGMPFVCLAWAPPSTDALLVSRLFDPTLVLWNTLDGTRMRTFFTHHSFQRTCMSFFPDDHHLEVAIVGAPEPSPQACHELEQGIIQIWSLSGDQQPVTITVGNEAFTFVDVSPDGSMITASPRDSRTMHVWNAQTLQPINTISTDVGGLHHLGFVQLP